MFIRQYNLAHAVDMDLSKCFDRLDHDLIVASIRRRVRDGSILALLRMFLESGVMIEGNWEATEIGSPQGGVISPLDFECVPGRLRPGDETSRPSHCAVRRRHSDPVPEPKRRLFMLVKWPRTFWKESFA